MDSWLLNLGNLVKFWGAICLVQNYGQPTINNRETIIKTFFFTKLYGRNNFYMFDRYI